MKKVIYNLLIVVAVASFIGCTGMPGYSSPEYPSIVGGNLSEIILIGMVNEQQNEITGYWKAKNVQNSTHSQIHFDKNGNFHENI